MAHGTAREGNEMRASRGWSAVFAVAFGVGACPGSPASPTEASPSPTPAVTLPPGVTQGQAYGDVDSGRSRLSLDLPKGIWHTDEAITGAATLWLLDVDSMVVGASSGGLVGFDFQQVGGDEHVEWMMTMDLIYRTLKRTQPMVVQFYKTAGYPADAPPTDFYRLFTSDPQIHLPAGTWTITAMASFDDYESSADGLPVTIEVPLTIYPVA
jgi:hypothetical protein